jgi:hypothetical protein
MMKDPTCPAAGLEELNFMLTHFVNRGEASQISKMTAHWGKSAITTARYKLFLLWLFPTLRKLEEKSFTTVIAAMSDEDRAAATIGGDGRWGTKGRTSKNGTYSAMVLGQSAYPDDPEQGQEMVKVAGRSYCKDVTANEQLVTGIKPWTRSSGDMDAQGACDSHDQLKRAGVTPRWWLGDDDASSQARIKGKGKGGKKKSNEAREACFGENDVTVQICCNHKVVNCNNLNMKVQWLPGGKKICKKMCPKKLKRGKNFKKTGEMETGKVECCWKSNIGVIQKIGRGYSRILRTSGPGRANTVFETQADVDRAVAEFAGRCEDEVHNHYLKKYDDQGRLTPCTNCTHGSEHVPKKGSCVTCEGQVPQIKNNFASKFTPTTLRKLFVVGQCVQENNIAEWFQNLCGAWLGKHINASAIEYLMAMMGATLHGNERYQWGLDPTARTWIEDLFADAADRVGSAYNALADSNQMLGVRARVRSSTLEAKRRRTKRVREMIAKSVKEQKQRKSAGTAQTNATYASTDAKALGKTLSSRPLMEPSAPSWGGGGPALKGNIPNEVLGGEAAVSGGAAVGGDLEPGRTCKCGMGHLTSPPHKTSKSKQCPRNRHLSAEERAAMADLYAISSGMVVLD